MNKTLNTISILFLALSLGVSANANAHELPPEVVQKIESLYPNSAPAVSPAYFRLREKTLEIFYKHLDQRISSIWSRSHRQAIYNAILNTTLSDQMPHLSQGIFDSASGQFIISAELKGNVMILPTLLHLTHRLAFDLTRVRTRNPVVQVVNFFDSRPGFWRSHLKTYRAEHDLITELWKIEDREITFADLVLEEFQIPRSDRATFKRLFSDMTFAGKFFVRNEEAWAEFYADPKSREIFAPTAKFHQLDQSLQKIYPIQNLSRENYACGKALSRLDAYSAGAVIRGLVLRPVKASALVGGLLYLLW